MSRSHRSMLAYGSGLASTAVMMAVSMAALPLLLGWLGEERYGASRALLDWFGYLALLELGLDGALLALFARALARGDRQCVRHTLRIGIRAYVGVTCLMVLAGLGLAALIKHLVPVADSLTGDLGIACCIATAGLLVIPLSPFRSLTEACQEGYWVNAASLLQSLGTTALALWLATRNCGISGQISAMVTGNVVFFGLLGWRQIAQRRKLRQWPKPRQAGRSDASSAGGVWHDLRRLNTPILLRRLCGRVGLLSDSLIVSALLGPTLVVPLYVTQRLAALVQSQLQGIGSASWAGMAELYAHGELETFNRRLIELTNVVAVLGVAVLAPIIAYNRYFIGRWVGAQHYGGDLLTAVAAANAFLLALTTLWDWCFGGTGQVARLVPVSLISTVVNVAVSIICTLHLGPVGPLLGTLFALLISSVWYLPLQLSRVFETPLPELISAVARPLFWGVPYGCLLWWFARFHEPWGWLGLAGEMGMAALLFLAMWWSIALGQGDRAA